MGGGGGARGLQPDELRRFEAIARHELRDAAQPRRRNVFLSFASEDLNEVNLLRGQAKNDLSDIEFNDWSVKEPFDSKNADYIKRGIRERIRQASLTIVYLSDNTHKSQWVNWEVEESLALGKCVIAVHKGDTPPAKLPESVINNRIRVIPWRSLPQFL